MGLKKSMEHKFSILYFFDNKKKTQGILLLRELEMKMYYIWIRHDADIDYIC